MKIDELEFGMKIRSSFRTALERQVGEAIAISREKKAGTTLLNSKAEFNRCKIHRLDTRNEKVKIKEITEDNENENRLKKIIKNMQLTKREREKENKKRTRDMKAALIEIQNEGLIRWKKRRKLQEKIKEESDKVEYESLEKIKRRNICAEKKRKFVAKLKKDSDRREWISEKKELWRNYRDRNINFSLDSSTIGGENLNFSSNMVFGNGENYVKIINEIGSKVQVKLKEPVFKRTFSDLKQSDYLKCNESSPVSNTFCLPIVPISPTETPASNEVDELDLLKLMMDWPDIFSLNTFKSMCDRVETVVNIDLNGQDSVNQSYISTNMINLDESNKLIESMNLINNVIKLISVKCFVDEFDSTVKVLDCKVKSDVDNQCHLQLSHENFNVFNYGRHLKLEF